MARDYLEDEVAHDDNQDEVTADMDNGEDFTDTDVLDDEEFTDTEVFSTEGAVDDFVGDSSVVFDVDDIVAEFESEASESGSPSSRLRKRLEAIAERKRRHDDLADFADYDLDF